ncbi:MAG: adenylate kinase [Thalassotalea sp.]|nr:adenylate kinase [Thalassotalea sp.]
MKRINVIGTSGSGKSTFSQLLAKNINAEYIEMDSLFWQPDWQESSNDIFFAKISHAIDKPTWVLDGNYSRSQSIKWKTADTIIWLDYGFFRTFYQVFCRSIKRAWNKNELWQGTGNKESFYKTFLHKDSIILWMLTNYHRNKLRYSVLMQTEEMRNKKFIRLKSPQEATDLLSEITRLS